MFTINEQAIYEQTIKDQIHFDMLMHDPAFKAAWIEEQKEKTKEIKESLRRMSKS